MPTKAIPARTQNEQKWHRMKKIKAELERCPRSSAELERLVFGNQNNKNNMRTLQNYLRELVELENINYDPTSGLYTIHQNKQTFQSKADYDVALTHSHNIFFYKIDEGTDYEADDSYFYNIRTTLLRLAFFEEDKKSRNEQDDEWETENTTGQKQGSDGWNPTFKRLTNFGDLEEDSDFQYSTAYLLQHIKTGYPDMFELIEQYKQFLTNQGVTSAFYIRKSDSVIEKILGIPPLKITKKEKQQFDNIESLFESKLKRLTRDVVDRIPLLGYCEGCPTSRITIKDKQEK